MENQGGEIHVDEQEASGGSKPHIVRYILGISLFLIVIAMSAVWIIPSIF